MTFKNLTFSRKNSDVCLFKGDPRKILKVIIELLMKRLYNMTNENLFRNSKLFYPICLYQLKVEDKRKIYNQLEELTNNLPHNV